MTQPSQQPNYSLPPQQSTYSYPPQYSQQFPPAPGMPYQFPRQRKGYKGPIVLTVVGAVLLAIAIFIGTVSMGHTIDNAPDLGALRPGNFDVDETMTLKADQNYGIYLTDEEATASCTVTSPSGSDIAVDRISYSEQINRYFKYSEFTSEEEGDYTIYCTSSPSSSDSYAIGEGVRVNELVHGIGGILGSFILGFISFFILLAGVIWWIVRAVQNSKIPPASAYPSTGY